jgi:hypothetical protein
VARANGHDGASVRRLEASPHELAVEQYILSAIISGAFAGKGFDLAGGINAGQFGMVYFVAKEALRQSISMYLQCEGVTLRAVSDTVMYDLLQEAAGVDSEIYREAWALECENPLSDEELIDYAGRVVHFYEDTLELKKRSPTYRYMNDEKDWLKMYKISIEGAQLIEHLGIEGMVPAQHRFENLLRERKKISQGLKDDGDKKKAPVNKRSKSPTPGVETDHGAAASTPPAYLLRGEGDRPR